MELLSSAPQSVEELAEKLPVSRPAVSQHLKRLLQAGLVNRTAAGRRNLYSVRTEGVMVLRDYAEEVWERSLSRFADLIKHRDPSNTTIGAPTPEE